MRIRRAGATTLATTAATATTVLLLAACASSAEDGRQDGSDPSDTVTATATVTETVAEPATSSATPTETPTEVPGEEVEAYFSTAGQEVGVAGLASEEEPIIVRDVPSSTGTQVAEVDRLGAVDLAGREWNNTQDPDEGFWAQVRVDGVTGWMPSAHLYHFAATTDVTDDYRDVTGDSEQEVVEAVGQEAASMAEYVLLTTPDYAGEPFYRVDVTGMKDDAQAGERLFVTVEENDGGYAAEKVERTLLCHRGVSGGLCL